MKGFVRSKSLWVVCLGSFKHKIVTSTNRDSIRSSFFSIPILLVFLAVLFWLSFQIVNWMTVERQTLCFIPNFWGNISVLFQRFYYERTFNVVKCFSCIYWDDYMISPWLYIYMCIYIYIITFIYLYVPLSLEWKHLHNVTWSS